MLPTACWTVLKSPEPSAATTMRPAVFASTDTKKHKRHKRHKRTDHLYKIIFCASCASCASCAFSWLKNKLRAELNVTRIISLRRHETESSVWRCRGSGIQTHARSEVRMIQRIQRFST